jgi:AcrR family transcriptional regulator
MKQSVNRIKDVPTLVKNPELVERRRRQIVDAAVGLFIQQGFHKTTTRQIAGRAGFAVGSLYEYVASKEDILYLVCEAIHAEVERGISTVLNKSLSGREALTEVIREYFLVCDRMSDHILLLYKETQSLPSQWRKRVLENEVRITGLFVEVLARLFSSGDLPYLNEHSVELISHNISVLGHMWTFRRWFLSRHYSIEDYIQLQTEFLLKIAAGEET